MSEQSSNGDSGRRWRRLHHLLGVALVLGWGVAVLAQQRGRRPLKISLEDIPPPSAAAATSSFSIYYKDQKIGFAESVRESLDDGGARFFDRAHWLFLAQGSVQRLSMESDALLDANWGLRSFRTRFEGGVAQLEARGQVRGDFIDLEILTGGRSIRERLPIEGPLLLPAMLRAYVAAQSPEPGTALQVEIYNPLIRGTEEIEIVVEERTKEGWRISEIMRGSIKTTAWIDEKGATLREESFMGFQIVAEPREQALAMPEDADNLPDLVFAATVPVRGEIGDPAELSSLSLRLLGIDASSFPSLPGGRQTLEGDVLTTRATQLPKLAPYALPFNVEASTGDAELDEALAAALAPGPLVQVDDPEIRAEVIKILEDEKEPVRAARRLAGWVNRKITKASSVGVPSAVEVLAVRSGDCNEHTVLYTALARAAGLPTRMAAGIVFADVGSGIPGMYYHAWPEVWLGDWYAVDPTLGQIPADATHLRFVVGGLDKQVAILRLIGALRVEVVGRNIAP